MDDECEDIELIIEREVKQSGHNGILYLPRRFVGRVARVIIKKDDKE